MSTKTTFKRVAAVAALALSLGGVTAISAHAASAGDISISVAPAASTNNFTSGNEAATETITATAGTNNFIGLVVTSSTTNPVVLSVTGGVATTSDTTATGSGTASLLLTANGPTAVNVPTPTVGTIVVKTYKLTGGVQATSASTTLTITVNAAATGVGTLNVSSSKAYISTVKSSAITPAQVHNVWVNGSISGSEATPIAADVTVLAAKGAAGTSALVAGIYGVLKDSQTPTAAAMSGKTLTATITGSGLIAGNTTVGTNVGTTPARVATTVTGDGSTGSSTAGEYAFNVYSDGTAGVGTVTISYTDSSNVTTVVATKSVTFYGAQASFTATVNKAYIEQGATTGTSAYSGATGETYVFKILVLDAAGNPVAGVTPTAKSSDTTKVSDVTCGASGSTGKSYCQATAVAGASGKVTVTFSTGAASTFDLVSTTADVTVSSKKAASFVVTADSSVAAGQVVTYTITAADANGLPLPDGTLVTDYLSATAGYRAVAGGALVDNGGNGNAVNALFTDVKFSGGVATDTVQAPFGTTTLTATIANNGTAAATVASSKFASLALTNAVATLTTAVTGDAATQAAIDAAQEATDAANAAYDAANNAMDSADAATAAAQDASDNASAALAAVTALSATVAKLVASVNSIAAALAKIQKKLKA